MKIKSITSRLVKFSLAVSFLLPAHLAANTLSVMQMGDSITQGVRGECGYRRALSQALSKNPGCAVNFVGSRSGAGDNSNTPIDVCKAQNNPHEATPGIRAEQLLNTIDSRINNEQPDVVMLHIGSNDIYKDRTVADTLTDVNTLLDRVFANQPNATVVVSNVIPWSEESPDPIFYAPFDNPNRDMLGDTSLLSAGLAALVNTRTAAGDSVNLANVRDNFDNDLMTVDGVHPNPVGEAHIANKMMNALYELGACSGQQIDVYPPISYIGIPATQDSVLPTSPTLSGTALDEGGSGIDRVRIAIQNSEGLWLNHASGTFSPGFDDTIVATMTNTTSNSTDWSITTNLAAGDYRLYALTLDNSGNQVEEAAGNGQPGNNDKAWTNRAFKVAASGTPKSTPETTPETTTDATPARGRWGWRGWGSR